MHDTPVERPDKAKVKVKVESLLKTIEQLVEQIALSPEFLDVAGQAAVEQIRSLDEAVQMRALLNELRDGIAETVMIRQPNDDPPPGELITVNGEWTQFKDRDYSGNTLIEALTLAVTTKRDVLERKRAS